MVLNDFLRYTYPTLNFFEQKIKSKGARRKIFIFDIFLTISLEINPTHPFYPILIPNTPYVKFFEEKNHRGTATKSWEKSRIFRYGLPKDFLSTGQKPQGGGRTALPPHGLAG